MFSAGQVAAPSAGGTSFSDTRGNRRIVGAVRRLERNINHGLQPADPAYTHVSVFDLTERFRQITDVPVSVRNRTALVLANAIWEFADSRPRVTGQTEEERVQSVTDGFGTFVESNVPAGLIRELVTKVTGVYRGLAENLERSGNKLNDPDVWDEYQEGIEFLNLAAQATVVADALEIQGMSYENIRTLDKLSELIIHNDTERVGTALLSMITRGSEGQILFPYDFANIVEMALTTADFSSWGNFAGQNISRGEISMPAWLYRIVNAAKKTYNIESAQEAAQLSIVTMLADGETGIAQRFLKVMRDSESTFSPVSPADEVQLATLKEDVYALAVLVSAQGELSPERRMLVDSTLALISQGFARPLTPIEYQTPILVENILSHTEAYPQIERRLVDLLDRSINPILTPEERSDVASLFMTFLMSVNQLYRELDRSGLPQGEKDYAASHSVAATLLEITSTQPLNPVRVILMEKAMTEDANDNLAKAMFYMGPLMDPAAQTWLNGLTDVTADNVDEILNRDFYRTGAGRTGGSSNGSASGSASSSSGPTTPPVTAPPAETEGAMQGAVEITDAEYVITDADESQMIIEASTEDWSSEAYEATYDGDVTEEGADTFFGAPWGETFVPEGVPVY